MSNNRPELLGDVIIRVMDKLNSRRKNMCDFFDDFDDFIDDGMEDTVDSDFNDDLNQDDDQNDGFTWDEVYWSGVALGWAYEEGKRERRRRKDTDSMGYWLTIQILTGIDRSSDLLHSTLENNHVRSPHKGRYH